jgi:hypothetical protein
VADLDRICVRRFVGSRTRRAIFDGFVALIKRLNEANIAGEIWVNGSFLTEKPDPNDVDILLQVSSAEYDSDPTKRAAVDWVSDENRLHTHSCDAYKWIEYSTGHPLYLASVDDRLYWSGWYGASKSGQPKGIAVIELPAVIE